MSKVVSLAAYRKPAPPVVELPTNRSVEAMEFISEYLYPWALANGVDLEGSDFKYESATIMAVVQGMLFKVNK